VALQLKTAAAVLMMLGIVSISSAAQTDQAPPPKELAQYIHDAKRRGEKETNIKEQAVAAGWPADVVSQAIVDDKGGKSAEASVSPAVAVTPRIPPSTPSPLPADTPAALPTVTPAAPSATGTNEGAPASGAPRRGAPNDYQIGAGDTLQISVWKEPDASVPSVTVRPDGKISVPLIKELEVVGLTPKQAEQRITEGLSKLINNPDVTVVVAAINSKKIYVIGAVRKEGTLSYSYGMSVMQALSEAGGLTDYAKRKKIYILRTESGREYRLAFNYDEVVKGERTEQNILMMAGDTLVIPH
jgi:polysaccharide export outer membrane protein